MSSVRGRIPTIFGGAYNISKHGMEVESDILRLEMKKFGVTVHVVQPCSFGGATQTMVHTGGTVRVVTELRNTETSPMQEIPRQHFLAESRQAEERIRRNVERNE